MYYLFNLNQQPLQSIFWPKQHKLIKQILLVVMGVVVLATSAQLSIPLQPVPLTFQSATVILIGMAYGARLGTAVIISYLIAGICGIPVFADFSAGIAKFLGPTGGYLVGFLPAAFLSGYLAQRGWARYVLSSFVVACLAAACIFLLGFLVLMNFVGTQRAFLLGVKPFLITEAIKLLAVSFIAPRLWKNS